MLGEGAIVLHRVAYALDSVRDRISLHPERFFESEELARPYEELRHRAEELDALIELFSAELGQDHEAVAAFVGARVALRDIAETLELLRDPWAGGAAGAPSSPEAIVERVGEHRASFDTSRDRFMDALRRSTDDQRA